MPNSSNYDWTSTKSKQVIQTSVGHHDMQANIIYEQIENSCFSQVQLRKIYGKCKYKNQTNYLQTKSSTLDMVLSNLSWYGPDSITDMYRKETSSVNVVTYSKNRPSLRDVVFWDAMADYEKKAKHVGNCIWWAFISDTKWKYPS